MTDKSDKRFTTPAGTGNKGKSQHIMINCREGEGCEDFMMESDPNPETMTEETIKMRICIRNHSVSLLYYWKWYIGVALFFAELFTQGIYSFGHFSAAYWFGGVSGTNLFVRSLIIASAVFLAKVSFGRWTTAHLDPVRSIAGAFTWVLTRGKDIGKGWVWIDLFKLVVFLIAQWLGVLIALSFLGLTTDTDIKTDDCSIPVPTPAVCLVYPIRALGVTTTTLAWQEGVGGALIYAILVWGERLFCWKWPGYIVSAIGYAAVHFFVHMMWSVSSGGSFNFWIWSMSGWFSNIDDPDRSYYVWPSIVGIGVVMIIDVVVYYFFTKVINSQSSTVKVSND